MSPLRHPGNDDLQAAAWLSADGLARGLALHLHAEGPRGTGKTTALRAFANRLPTIARIAGCPYNCDPAAPHCPLHRGLPPAAVAAAGREDIATPFLEVSASAKLATVVGTIDLPRLLDPRHPEAALLPGTLARAHRGIVFVDEINRLADVAPELADALLDVMGTKPGRLQIEEAGLPTVVVPTLVAVWAASNPDEEPGPLEQTRLQLADRFDLRPAVVPPGDAAVVLAILRGEAGGGDVDEPPLGGGHGDPAWPDPLLRFMADFYLRAGLGSLRALQAWRHAAAGLARHGGRRHVVAADVRRAARLTLRGRLAADAVEAGLRGLEAAVATGPGADAGAAGAGADAGAAGAGADAGAAGAGADAGAAGAGADAGAAGAGADAGAAGSGADAGAAGAGADAGSAGSGADAGAAGSSADAGATGAGADAGAAGAGAVGGRGPRPISAVSPLAAPEWTGQSEAAE